MPEWEYCVLGPIYSSWEQGRPTYRGGGPEGATAVLFAEKFRPVPYRRDGTSIVATLASLGAEGWEMVGCGTFDRSHCIYFKRPKE